jgi:hypothetical protein
MVYEAKQPCPVSARNLAIPMHAELSTNQVERVADALRALRTHVRPHDRGGVA